MKMSILNAIAALKTSVFTRCVLVFRSALSLSAAEKRILARHPGEQRCWRCGLWEPGVACRIEIVDAAGKTFRLKTKAWTQCVFSDQDPEDPALSFGDPELHAARERIKSSLVVPSLR